MFTHYIKLRMWLIQGLDDMKTCIHFVLTFCVCEGQMISPLPYCQTEEGFNVSSGSTLIKCGYYVNCNPNCFMNSENASFIFLVRLQN